MRPKPQHNNLWIENIKQAFSIIRARRLRSILLILGVAIGITTLLTMITVMSGLVKKINQDLESSTKPYLFVTRFNMFTIDPDDEEVARRPKFVPADAAVMAERVPLIDEVCYFITQNDVGFIIYYKGEHTPPLELDGASHTFPRMFSFPLEYGRHYTEFEVEQRERVIVLGFGPAEDLFPHENPLGKFVSINGYKYRVIGTFANRDHFIGSISNNFAVIPYSSYHKDFQTDKDDPSIAANVKDGFTLEDAEQQMTGMLRMHRRVEPGEDNNFYITTSEAFMDIINGVTFAVSAVLVVIASIGLLVGGIGVMNIMLISVAERTREIGVRRAMGANKKDIMQQFLTESVTLTGIGGVVGTLFGILFAFLVSRQINFPFYFSIPWTIIAVAFSALIGVIFGLYPARRAARLDPVEALRRE